MLYLELGSKNSVLPVTWHINYRHIASPNTILYVVIPFLISRGGNPQNSSSRNDKIVLFRKKDLSEKRLEGLRSCPL
jgi:hypothetical protein